MKILRPFSLVITFILSAVTCEQAFSQALHIGSARAQRGQTANVTVSFVANPAAPVAAFELKVGYDRTRLNPPSCTALQGALCIVDAYGRVTIMKFDDLLNPLLSSNVAVLHFPVRTQAFSGPTSLGANFFAFVSPSAESIWGTVHTGRVMIY